ncbi:hypothetical protein [Streptomyces sp. NPDC001601]|uniref:hypothetical protein n=1 Tax=unclassified Streptomyces TaxID=2593676 RepID=UPI003696F9D6
MRVTAPVVGPSALAFLGSSWLGTGTGLPLRPAFWSAFVPWCTGRLDAQVLGVWALA